MLTQTKRILGWLLALLMIFSVPAMAETTEIKATYDLVSVRVNGNYINAPSYLYQNYVYVPLRAVLEAMGAEVLWNGETQSISITTKKAEPKMEPRTFAINEGEDRSFEAHTNYFKISIDGEEKMISHFLLDGTTYVPVSVFYDHFSCHVLQHQGTMSVRIYSPEYKTFGENEVFYVNDTAYTTTEVQDISAVMTGRPNPTTLNDYAYVEDFLLNASVVQTLGEQTISADGFSEYYDASGYDKLIRSYGIKDVESFTENVIWPMYYSQNITEETFGLYLNPTDEDLANFLPTSPYGQGRWLKAKHILIEKTEDGSGLKLAEELLSKVKDNPLEFDSLMKTYSKDPGSAEQPEGYLFTEGQMVTEFYEATLPLQVGEISGIVESSYGYHIILKVADYENGVPMEEVKDELKRLYINNTYQNMLIELMAETDTVLNRAVIAE